MPEITYKYFNVLLTKKTIKKKKNLFFKLTDSIAYNTVGEKKPIHAEGVFMGKNSENSDSSERGRKTEK